MLITNKQFLHYQSVAKQSLDKFIKIAENKLKDELYKLVVNDWQSFIEDESRLKRYIDHVEDASSIFGFSRELSGKLNYDDLMSRVAERFAEVDLAEHAIRELGLSRTGTKLVKLAEGPGKKCDFKLHGDPSYYFESKYTKNLSTNHLTNIIQDALDQIKNSIDKTGIGCIWVFTYIQPEEPRAFQTEIMKIKNELFDVGFSYKLNVQVYSQGLYGDASIV